MTTTAEAASGRQMSRELGVSPATITYWIKQGWVTVLEEPTRGGGEKLLDRQSVLNTFAIRAKKDRRHRTRTPKRPRARPPHPATAPPLVVSPARARASTPTPTDSGSMYPSIGPPPNGTPPPYRTWSTASLLTEHLAEAELQHQSPETVQNKRYHVGLFVDACPQLPISRADLVKYLKTVNGADATVKTRQAWVGGFLNWAEISGGPVAPNMKRILPELKLPPPASLSIDEMRQLLAGADSLHDQLMLQTLYYGGLRAGELASLDRDGIGEVKVSVKGKSGPRDVHVPAELCVQLRRLGPRHVFSDSRGKRIRSDGVTSRVRKYFDKAGLNPGRRGPHVLRHSFGRHMTEHGVTLKVVAEMLGHSTTRMAERYGKPGDEHVAEVYKQYSLDQYMNGGSNDH